MGWQAAEVQNISRSGVLIATPLPVAPDTEIEMLIDMQVAMDMDAAALPGMRATTPGRLLCRGRVVRVVTGKGREVGPAMAATIADFRFVRTDDIPEES